MRARPRSRIAHRERRRRTQGHDRTTENYGRRPQPKPDSRTLHVPGLAAGRARPAVVQLVPVGTAAARRRRSVKVEIEIISALLMVFGPAVAGWFVFIDILLSGDLVGKSPPCKTSTSGQDPSASSLRAGAEYFFAGFLPRNNTWRPSEKKYFRRHFCICRICKEL